MENNYVKIALAVITVIGAILGGAFYSKKKVKNKKYQIDQRDITITGDNNKIVGGDDNSIK